MLDVGAYHPGRVLRAQRQRLTFLWTEGVHLLRDNVCFFANSAGEELGFFKDRSTDFAKGIALENLPCDRFDVIPESGLGRQKVPSAADSLQDTHMVVFTGYRPIPSLRVPGDRSPCNPHSCAHIQESIRDRWGPSVFVLLPAHLPKAYS